MAIINLAISYARLAYSMRFASRALASIKTPPPSSNARILISRNKREGGYCGFHFDRHRRAGGLLKLTTLREWSRA